MCICVVWPTHLQTPVLESSCLVSVVYPLDSGSAWCFMHKPVHNLQAVMHTAWCFVYQPMSHSTWCFTYQPVNHSAWCFTYQPVNHSAWCFTYQPVNQSSRCITQKLVYHSPSCASFITLLGASSPSPSGNCRS